MKPYKHFTTEERKCLQQFLSEGLSFRKIADLLERSPSSISREVNRNKAKYKPHSKADNKYWYNIGALKTCISAADALKTVLFYNPKLPNGIL